MKNNFYKNKGFTLIELLVVVAIIGLLSSIVMASLNTARLKGKDSFLQEEALQMRILLEEEYSETGSYLGLQSTTAFWMDSSSDCDNAIFTGNHASEARSICKAIVANASVTWYGGKFFLGNSSNSKDKYSILIALPFKDTFFCIGSSGAVSNTTNSTNMWGQPGCYANP
ncbi:MAG: prepilin-type N-terminal cleavage/methylation domain-containing protein [Candidatus Paceibacterota bacterium]|jgi:prepilin-type N-terminal cleavage/methylation domain-containing protein